MPFIEGEDLVKLYDEVDNLSVKNEELRQGFIDIKLKNNKHLKKQKYGQFIILILSLLILLLGFMLYQSKGDINEFTLSQKKFYDLKVDSINRVYLEEKKLRENNKDKSRLVFTIQIGAFKGLNLDSYPEEELKNFKRSSNENLYTYSIGEFSSLEQAKIFMRDIKKIGIKDAFILPLKNNKKISLEQAISESNKSVFYNN
ncbi:hypothetical protein C7447_103277 [Tenacibaculum adriaticum]|uniref:Sporulation related protein n=1 Tax=Tenacibaculum adriaticum TaxID=413713 RepID=A0A5S5DQE5_9FLAO|nr:SPOR domain-containing protein [Tenacibaculum adriaticum]TYP98107.1 hypothetical protein C7447_103277 [Tenacibaculum adriaticum]